MIERKVIGMAPAVRLGMLRAVICSAAIFSVAMERLSAFAEVSAVWYQPAGFLKWLPHAWMHTLLSSGGMLLGFQLLLILFLLMAAAGILTGFSLAVSMVLYFIYAGILRSYGTYFNSGFVLLYLLFFMIFLAPGSAFSIDAGIRRKRGEKPDLQPHQSIGWSVFLLRAVVALSFWQAACAKLHFTGLPWIDWWNVKRFFVADNLTFGSFDSGFISHAVQLPETFWSGLAGAYLGLELFFPLVLVSWDVRRYYPLAAAALQILLIVLCPALVLDAGTALILLLVFFDWDRVLLKHLLPPQDRRSRTKSSSAE